MNSHEIGLRIAFTCYSEDPEVFKGINLTQYTNEIIAAYEHGGYEAVQQLTGWDAAELKRFVEEFPVVLA